MRTTVKALRKIVILIAGVAVLICGAILLVVPGPGLLVIVAGLLILSIEFDWAKRYLHQARTKLNSMNQAIRNKNAGKKSADDIDRTGNDKRKRKS